MFGNPTVRRQTFAGTQRPSRHGARQTGNLGKIVHNFGPSRKFAGGETHTFTLVKVFGGGFVPPLNALSGNPTPAPECVNPGDPTIPAPPSPKNVFVEAGAAGAFQTAGLLPGRYMFQCCVHPWMRVILTVK